MTRPIDIPAPGESLGCADLLYEVAMRVAKGVTLMGMLLLFVGTLTLLM